VVQDVVQVPYEIMAEAGETIRGLEAHAEKSERTTKYVMTVPPQVPLVSPGREPDGRLGRHPFARLDGCVCIPYENDHCGPQGHVRERHGAGGYPVHSVAVVGVTMRQNRDELEGEVADHSIQEKGAPEKDGRREH
jgi:hypothetical protein